MKSYGQLRISLALLYYAKDLSMKFWQIFKLLAEILFVWH